MSGMSQTLAPPQTVSSRVLSPTGTWTALLLLLGVGLHLPLAIPQGLALWESEHYSFWPLACLAFAYLVYDRLEGSQVRWWGFLSLQTVFLLLCNIALLTLATLARSYWIGWVSLLFFTWIAASVILAPKYFVKIRSAFLVLLLIIPPPLGLDNLLVIQLQKFATDQASQLLDYSGLLHMIAGVTIQLPGKAFQIDDACSGIHSLFSAITTMLVFAVFSRYGGIRILATLAQTVLWVLVINSLRVFLVVYAYHHWNAGLESGLRHEILGFAGFALILLFALSTDQLIRYFFPLKSMSRQQNADKSLRLMTSLALGRHLQWLRTPLSRPTTVVVTVILAVGFLSTGLLAVAERTQSARSTSGGHFDQKLAYELEEDSFPETLQGWRRVGYRQLNRDKLDPFGANSLIWTYERDGLVAQFSIDGAYHSFHDLWYCYSSTGWKLRESQNLQLAPRAASESTEVATEYQLYQTNGEEAHVIYSCLDSMGQTVEPPEPAETALRRLVNRLRAGELLPRDANPHYVPPVIQFQLFSHSDQLLHTDDRLELRAFFAEIRHVARQKLGQADSSP